MDLRIENMTCGGWGRAGTRGVQAGDPRAKVENKPGRRPVKGETAATPAAVRQVLEEAGYPATKT